MAASAIYWVVFALQKRDAKVSLINPCLEPSPDKAIVTVRRHNLGRTCRRRGALMRRNASRTAACTMALLRIFTLSDQAGVPKKMNSPIFNIIYIVVLQKPVS